MGLWWEDDPERYEDELAELRRANIRWEEDAASKADGVLRLRVFPVVEGAELPLVATFPDEYPWFKFEVEAPTLDLPHHQHAFGKTLCLLPRDTGYWRPASDRLATFLTERLPLVLETGAAAEAPAADVEEPQGEPFSDYYTYERRSIVLIDGGWTIPAEAVAGPLIIGVPAPPRIGKPSALLRGAVLEVRDDRGGPPLAVAPRELVSQLPHKIEGRWVRVPDAIRTEDARVVFRAMQQIDPHANRLRVVEVEQRGQTMRVRAALFPEEHRWRGEPGGASGDGWLFAVCVEHPAAPVKGGVTTGSSRFPMPRKGRPPAPQRAETCYLARAGRAGRADLRARIPELAPMADARIAIVGLGCLGAPSALEFARAMAGELRLVEYDFIDPATTVRWPFGLSAAGLPKLDVITDVIRAQYPYTRIDEAHRHVVRIGSPRIGPRPAGDPSAADALAAVLDGVSLLYDATADLGIQHYLARQAYHRGIPYLAVSGTLGAWGGVVLRIRPGQTEGCWACLRHAFNDGTIPSPPVDPTGGECQPAGCADPTYTGANFDLAPVAMMGVRLAVATLCGAAGGAAGATRAYPDFDWDVAVLALRDEAGRPIAPQWSTHRLARHPACRASTPHGG